MNKQLFFLIIACSLFVLSIIAINVAPIISKANSNNSDVDFSEWHIQNCQILDDEYKYKKKNARYDNSKALEKYDKKIIDECKRHKVMYGLEYSAFVIDVSLGFICSFLGLFHFLEPGKPLEKVSGLIGISVGIITAVITLIYLIFSGLIYSDEPVRDIEILYPNKASLKYNGAKYVFDYDYEKLKDDLDIKYIKYKDLGKKQYNYDTEIFKSEYYYADTEYENCQENDPESYYLNQDGKQKVYYVDGKEHKCDYIWENNVNNEYNFNKYLHDRWITCIILSVVIAVCGIGLILFGFLLLKSEGDSGSNPIPQ